MANTLIIPGADFSEHKIETVILETIPCTGIALDKQTKNLTTLAPFTLTATPVPETTTDTVVWSSSDNTVATVVNGVVTPLKLGEVAITATCGNYSAVCAVTINNVVPDYVAVCGYDPKKRSSQTMATYTDKKTSDSTSVYIIAKNQASGLYPIESKPDVSTDPYRFVPILIPTGANKIKVSCTLGNFYTRTLYFDSTKQETLENVGAWCVQGVSSGYDQQSSGAGPFTFDIPENVSGLDSVAFAIATGGSVPAGTTGQDYSDEIGIEFLYNNDN